MSGKVKKREFFPLHFLLPPFLFSRGKRESIASSGAAAAAAVGFFTLPDEGGGGGEEWCGIVRKADTVAKTRKEERQRLHPARRKKLIGARRHHGKMCPRRTGTINSGKNVAFSSGESFSNTQDTKLGSLLFPYEIFQKMAKCLVFMAVGKFLNYFGIVQRKLISLSTFSNLCV